jgi:hypothetical protein
MDSNALFKFGQITILTLILATSILPPAEASNLDPSNTKRDSTTFTKGSHRRLNVPNQKRTSEEIQFNTIDGEPLN